MNIFKYIGYFFLGGLVIKLLFTSSLVQFIIVLAVFVSGLYFLIKHQLFWKIYAFVFAAIAIAASIGFIFFEYELYDYIDIPFIILTSIALFGFAYKIVILNRLVWIVVFFINIFYLIIPYGEGTSIFEDINDLGIVGGTILLILYFYLFLTQYLGLFLYAFYSDNIWKEPQN